MEYHTDFDHPMESEPDMLLGEFCNDFDKFQDDPLDGLPEDNYLTFERLFDTDAQVQPQPQPQPQPVIEEKMMSLKQRMLRGRFSSLQQRIPLDFLGGDSNLKVETNSTNAMPRNSLSNTTMVNTPTPPDEIFNTDNLLEELNWDMNNHNQDALSVLYGDSTTLASETRTSYDFRESSEFFESFQQPVLEQEQQTNKSRFTSSLSNSLSNIFRSNNNNSGSTSGGRFNLRSINPLSTHKDADLMVSTLPDLSEDVENLSIEHADESDSKKKDLAAPVKKKKKTTSSLVNALASARLGFRDKQNSHNQTSIIGTEDANNFEFKEELTRVISMASMNSSSYNFNAHPRPSYDPSVSDATSFHTALQNGRTSFDIPSSFNEQYEDLLGPTIKIDDASDEASGSVSITTTAEQQPTEKQKHSPDYAALFSDVNIKKKSNKSNKQPKQTKSLSSFRRMVGSQPQSNTSVEENVDLDPSTTQTSPQTSEPSSTRNSFDTNNSHQLKKETAFPPLPEGITLPIVPPANEPPRRGRKPTLEYDASKQFVCSYCLRRFRRQEHLKRHFRSLHTNEKPFDCTLCGKKFSRSDNLAQHIKTHSEGNDDGDGIIEEGE